MKNIIFTLMFIFSIFLIGDECKNYYANHNCGSNQTLVSIENSNISFSALAKWSLNKIEYSIKKGSEILRIDVRKEGDYLVYEMIYRNRSAHLKFSPDEKKFSTDDPVEFFNFINSMQTGFLQSIQELIGQENCPSSVSNIIDMYNFLTNPMILHSIDGLIPGKIIVGGFGDWACYAVCYYACMAGCQSQGFSFEECSDDCQAHCKDWCGINR